MDGEQQAELGRLETSAMSRLRDGDWKLRLGMYPAFEDCVMLGSRFQGSDWTVVERVWRRVEDSEKFRSPVERLRHPRVLQPTIRERSVGCTRSFAAALLSQLEDLQVPVLPPSRVIGTDGIEFELFGSVGFHCAHFRWWQDRPAEWMPLMNWFESAWRAISTLLDGTTSSQVPVFPWAKGNSHRNV